MSVCVVAGIKYKSMCCCMKNSWDYVLWGLHMELCFVPGITHAVCCSWDYISDYVLLQGLSMGYFIACITHEMCCNRTPVTTHLMSNTGNKISHG